MIETMKLRDLKIINIIARKGLQIYFFKLKDTNNYPKYQEDK